MSLRRAFAPPRRQGWPPSPPPPPPAAPTWPSFLGCGPRAALKTESAPTFARGAATQACVVVRKAEPPAGRHRTGAPPPRQHGGRTRRGAEPEDAAAPPDADEAAAARLAMPPALPGEPAWCGGERAAAFERCWAELDGRMDAVLRAADRAALEQLADFVRRSACGPADAAAVYAAAAGRGGAHEPADFSLAGQVPTALVLAGSINAADLRGTFSALAAHLRAGGAHVAHIRSDTLAAAPAGEGLGWLLGAALRQWSGPAAGERPGPAHRALLRLWRRGAAPGPAVLLLEDGEGFPGQLLCDLLKASASASANLIWPAFLILDLEADPRIR